MALYSAKCISVLVNSNQIQGFANDFINWDQNSDRIIMQSNAHGDTIVSSSYSNDGAMTLILSYDSPSNKYLMSLLDGQAAAGLPVQVTLQVKDTQNKITMFSGNAYVSNVGVPDFGTTPENWAWKFKFGEQMQIKID